MKLLVIFLLELYYFQDDYFKAAQDIAHLTEDFKTVERDLAATSNVNGREGDLAAMKKKRSQLIRELERLRGLKDARVCMLHVK